MLSVVKAEADYGGSVRASKQRSWSGHLTSVSECMLRAANMEDSVTQCSTFTHQTLTEGLLLTYLPRYFVESLTVLLF